MRKHNTKLSVAIMTALVSPFVVSSLTFAASADVSRIQTFMVTIITAVIGLAGTIATLFIVIGGVQYSTSTGSPDKLDKAKRTILYAAIGLAISLGAFIIINIVTQVSNGAFGS